MENSEIKRLNSEFRTSLLLWLLAPDHLHICTVLLFSCYVLKRMTSMRNLCQMIWICFIVKVTFTNNDGNCSKCYSSFSFHFHVWNKTPAWQILTFHFLWAHCYDLSPSFSHELVTDLMSDSKNVAVSIKVQQVQLNNSVFWL